MCLCVFARADGSLTEVVQQLLLQGVGLCVLERSSLLLRSSDSGGL